MKHDLIDQAYIDEAKSVWRSLPDYLKVVEYYDIVDPYVGRIPDDRLLNENGELVEVRLCKNPAVFYTVEDAHEAAKKIKNRRPGGKLSVSANWKIKK